MTNIIMEEADIIKNMESLMEGACKLMERNGHLKQASPELRDWWGKRKAQMRARADLPMEKWGN